jgi:nicotinamide phosphoribosyltransferase
MSLSNLDGYKLSHKNMETPGTQLIYSNFTPRKSRTGFPGVIWFGLQAYLKKMKKSWDDNFFSQPRSVVQKYHNMFNRVCGHSDSSHFERLHDLGYLPLEIRSAKEGEFVKCGVPTLVLWNTHPDFSWLTNFIETDLSNNLWFPSTSATTAFQYLINFTRGCRETCNEAMIPYLAHDFSYRGMTSLESAQLSGAAHLTCFDGTDTFPAIEFVQEYYDDQVGSSVPASEHSVASLNILYNQSLGMSQEDAEVAAIKRLITEVYPNGILSLVCDTFDYWRVITEILPQLKSEILARNGKLVVRPDSGDPVKIICGDPSAKTEHERNGSIQCLWNIFGGITNGKGYCELDSHIGLIYGDSITLARQEEILSNLEDEGFAANNVVLGVGSYTYQYVTRDTYGWAVKATAARVNGVDIPLYKDPKTDDGTKKSLKGFLHIKNGEVTDGHTEHDGYDCVFKDGEILRHQTFGEIRQLVKSQLEKFV